MRSIISISLFVLIATANVFGQDKVYKSNELDNQYTPDKNSIFNSDQSKSSSSSSGSSQGNSSTATFKNIVKFYPGLFARSAAALFYERYLTEGISAQAGIGYCYNKDRLQMVFSESYDDLYSNSSSSVSFSQILNDGEMTSGPNLYGGFSFRFYRESYYTDANIYFEIDSRFYHHTLILDNYSDYNLYYNSPTVNINNMNFNFNFGRAYYSDGKVKMSHEFYMGLGFRTSSFDKFELKEINVIEFGVPTTREMNVKTTERDRYFTSVFLIGYAFGIGF